MVGAGVEVEGDTCPELSAAAEIPATEIPTDNTVSATQPVYATQGITSHRS